MGFRVSGLYTLQLEALKIFSFEKLRFWDEVRELIKTIYNLTKTFPDDEKFGLVNQMRRAVVSVSSNIAEGSSRVSFKDQAHFYQIAFGSLIELLSQIIVSKDLGYCTENELREIRKQIENISIQLNALRKAQANRNNQ